MLSSMRKVFPEALPLWEHLLSRHVCTLLTWYYLAGWGHGPVGCQPVWTQAGGRDAAEAWSRHPRPTPRECVFTGMLVGRLPTPSSATALQSKFRCRKCHFKNILMSGRTSIQEKAGISQMSFFFFCTEKHITLFTHLCFTL